MIYADYAYYLSDYKGAMPETDYDRLSRRASAHLNTITFGRIDGEWAADTRVKDACCALAEEMYKQEQGGEVTGETVGKWSRAYASSGKSAEGRLYAAAAQYMSTTGLLYRGVMA